MILRLLDEYLKPSQLFEIPQKEATITEDLSLGYKTLKISLPITERIIKEQEKLEVEDYLYVVKEVNIESESYYTVYCKPYLGDLLAKNIPNIDGPNMTLEDCLRPVLEDTSWHYVIFEDVFGRRAINISDITAVDAIDTLKRLFQFEYFLDTKKKELQIWKTRSSNRFDFVIDSMNLRSCRCQSNTYNLVTRLIPIGKNGITINSLNDGKLWVEDYSYTKDIIVGYWVNSDITTVDDLLSIAEERIKAVAQPQTSYQIKLTNLPSIQIGDRILIVDKIRNITHENRVQKIVRYTNRPDKSYIDVGDPRVSFDDIYKDFKTAQKLVNEGTLKNLTELNINSAGKETPSL